MPVWGWYICTPSAAGIGAIEENNTREKGPGVLRETLDGVLKPQLLEFERSRNSHFCNHDRFTVFFCALIFFIHDLLERTDSSNSLPIVLRETINRETDYVYIFFAGLICGCRVLHDGSTYPFYMGSGRAFVVDVRIRRYK